MISVIIQSRNAEHPLAVTLGALVPAAAEGFVREVIVVDEGSTDGTRLVADALGCTVLEGSASDALDIARSDWVLLLAPGVRLESDWFREAAVFIEQARRAGPTRAASFRHAVDEFGWRARLSEVWSLARSRFRMAGPLLAPRATLRKGQKLRLSRLRARAFVGGLSPA
jgi:glycosyltransferase involved in cell wall biosynthesis